MYDSSIMKILKNDDKKERKKADSFSLNFNQSWGNVNHSERIQETLDVGEIINSETINSFPFANKIRQTLVFLKNKNNSDNAEEKFIICNLF